MAVAVVIWIFTGLVTIDAFRRPKSDWVVADRNRGWWLTGLVISCVLLLSAPFFVLGYLFGVLPHMRSVPSGAQRQPGRNGASRPQLGNSVDEFRRR